MNDVWYIVAWSSDENFALVDEAPRRANGEMFDDANSVDEAYVNIRDQRPVGDCMAILGGYFVVSARARRVLESVNIDDTIDYVPVLVEHPSVEEAYWLLRTAKRWSVLDRDQSTYSYYPGTTVIEHVDKWVLAFPSIPSVDLFQGDKGKWFCSPYLQSRVSFAGLTGFQFDPVIVSNRH